MNKKVLNLLGKPFVIQMALLIFGQQALIALSNYALGMAGKNTGNSNNLIFYFVAFLLCSFLPHILTVFIRKTEMGGYLRGYYNFLQQKLFLKKGDPRIWVRGDVKETFLTAIGSDSEVYLTAIAFCMGDIYLLVLSILLNLTALSFLLDKEFALIFTFSGLVSWLIFRFCRPNIEKAIELEQEQKLSFFSYLLTSWDQIFLNNKNIHQKYESKLHGKYEKIESSAAKAALISEKSVLLLTVVSYTPAFAYDLFFIFKNLENPSNLAALLVTLPSQLMVLGYFRGLFQQITNLTSFTSRFKSLWENSELQGAALDERIKTNEIKQDGSVIASTENYLEQVTSKTPGRYLITGKNGAGKSTLLLHLNSHLEDSFYLPSNPRFEIQEDIKILSTGESMLSHLEYISKLDTKYLLLDEWDANLDFENRSRVEQLLNKISAEKIIIEVSHSLLG
jgi:ABC-type multidrug transport system fused ATPase/permease subunit